MKKILFLVSNRVHLARQQKLLNLLKEKSELFVEEVRINQSNDEGDFEAKKDLRAAECYLAAGNFITKYDPDIVLVRGDRFEMLPVAMVASYRGKTVAHIEGGDKSGAIDNKVRHAISQLADIHFPTNDDAVKRLKKMGIPAKHIHQVGSLDVELAHELPKEEPKEEYILVLHHEIKGEMGSYREVEQAVQGYSYKKIYVKSNNDYATTTGEQEFSPEKFLQLLYGAKCAVGNSSSFIKEAGIMGTPVVLVGNRQDGRVRTRNIIDTIPRDREITREIGLQLIAGRYDPDLTYYGEKTAEKIVDILTQDYNKKTVF